MLPMQGAWVQSLVRELRSHKSRGIAKKKQEREREKNIYILLEMGSTLGYDHSNRLKIVQLRPNTLKLM